MAILIHTANPVAFVVQIRNKINEGTIETWMTDSQGDFTHSPHQWRYCSWFRPYLLDEDGYNLVFVIIPSKKHLFTRTLYGLYHGRFTEMLLTHFGAQITKFKITPSPEKKLDYSP